MTCTCTAGTARTGNLPRRNWWRNAPGGELQSCPLQTKLSYPGTGQGILPAGKGEGDVRFLWQRFSWKNKSLCQFGWIWRVAVRFYMETVKCSVSDQQREITRRVKPKADRTRAVPHVLSACLCGCSGRVQGIWKVY